MKYKIVGLMIVLVSVWLFCTGMVLSAKWYLLSFNDKTLVLTHSGVINKLIECESGGRNITVLDSNGKYSHGILQYQKGTWDMFSKKSGIKGSPLIEEDAMRMTDWAIDNGYLHHWSCAYIRKLL